MAENDVTHEEKAVHGGVSPVNVPGAEDEDKAFQMLWVYFVPPCVKIAEVYVGLLKENGIWQIN